MLHRQTKSKRNSLKANTNREKKEWERERKEKTHMKTKWSIQKTKKKRMSWTWRIKCFVFLSPSYINKVFFPSFDQSDGILCDAKWLHFTATFFVFIRCNEKNKKKELIARAASRNFKYYISVSGPEIIDNDLNSFVVFFLILLLSLKWIQYVYHEWMVLNCYVDPC